MDLCDMNPIKLFIRMRKHCHSKNTINTRVIIKNVLIARDTFNPSGCWWVKTKNKKSNNQN